MKKRKHKSTFSFKRETIKPSIIVFASLVFVLSFILILMYGQKIFDYIFQMIGRKSAIVTKFHQICNAVVVSGNIVYCGNDSICIGAVGIRVCRNSVAFTYSFIKHKCFTDYSVFYHYVDSSNRAYSFSNYFCKSSRKAFASSHYINSRQTVSAPQALSRIQYLRTISRS